MANLIIGQSEYDRLTLSLPDLVSYWPCEESSGTIIADRKSANDGAIAGTVTLARDGPPGGTSRGAIKGDGSTGQIVIPSATALNNLSTAFSVVIWYNLDGDSDAILIEKTIGGTVNTQFSIFADGGGVLRGRIKPSGAFVTIGAGAVGDLNWHMAVLTYDGTDMRLYKDASLDSGPTACGNATTGAGQTYIGSPAGVGGYFSSARECRGTILSRDLSLDEITVLYNANTYRPQINLKKFPKPIFRRGE